MKLKEKETKAVQPASKKLRDIASRYWEFNLKRYPTFATFVGDKRYDDKLPDISEEAIETNLKTVKEFLSEARSIKESELSGEDVLTRKLLILELENEIGISKFKVHRWSVDHIEGDYDVLTSVQRLANIINEKDLQNLVARYNAYPELVKQYISNLKKGALDKRFAPDIAVTRTIDKLTANLKNNLAGFTYFKHEVKNIPNSDKYVKQIEALVAKPIRRAVEKLLSYLDNDVKPKARGIPGVCGLDYGQEYYAFVVKYHTTLDYTPEQLHKIGLEQLKSNQNDVMKIAKELKFKGSLKQFIKHIQDNPKNHPSDRDQYLDLFNRLYKKIREGLPRLFDNLPKIECVIKPVEEAQEKNAPAAFYYPPALDGSRPGIFYVNLYDLPSRYTYIAPALTAHEAEPGHHLQHAYNLAVNDLPNFRKYFWSTAFGEGWAHYSELLGKELGIYENKISMAGMLFEQAWRAARLVVDAGIHSLGWSRDKAIKFFEDNIAIGHTDAVNEIDRYIVWPGQALAYKVGQLEFSRLRELCSKKLGSKFSVGAFHYEVLRHGTLPLSILREVTDNWIRKRLSA